MTGNGPSTSAAARATVVSNLPEYTVGEIWEKNLIGGTPSR